MRKFFGIASALTVVVVTAVVGLAAFSGGSSAAEGEGSSQPRHKLPPPSLVAIAIGQVTTEASGETATVDLHAAIRNGRATGNLRFFSEEYGYYNGGVRTLKVEDGVITATGAGGLFKAAGSRMLVRYTAVIGTDDEHVVIAVKGKDGLEYTIQGGLDGFTWAGDPSVEKPPAR